MYVRHQFSMISEPQITLFSLKQNADKTPTGSSNTEFANMWKELKSKENNQLESTPVTTESSILDETQPTGLVEELSPKMNNADSGDEQLKAKESQSTFAQVSTSSNFNPFFPLGEVLFSSLLKKILLYKLKFVLV